MQEEIFKEWKHSAKEKFKENLEFLSTLRGKKKVDGIAAELHDQVFGEVDCLACANCCKTTPALVERSDVKRIAKHLKIPPKTFIRKYLIEDINGELMIARVPCTFLNEDNTCRIYEVRPNACREYPHTNQIGFHRRAKLNAKNTIVCPATYAIVTKMQTMDL